jgi:hypothetical protein
VSESIGSQTHRPDTVGLRSAVTIAKSFPDHKADMQRKKAQLLD